MDWLFRISCGSVRPVCIPSREKSSQVSVMNNKEELNSKYVLNFSTWSSLRHLRQPLHRDPSAFCWVILGGKWAQAGIERDRSGLVKISGRMERTQAVQANYFVRENHELVIWKKRMFFGRTSSEVLTAIFLPGKQGSILHLLDLMRQWIFKCLASENFVLATGSNLSLATGLASWKVSLEPCPTL